MSVTDLGTVVSAAVAAACVGYALATRRRPAEASEPARPSAPSPSQPPPRKSTTPKAVKAEPVLARVEYEEDDEIDPTRVGAGAPRQPVVAPIVYDEEAANEEPTSAQSLFLLSATAQTDKGLRRKRNEDSLLVDNDHHLFAVADGMGGYRGGEVASRLAVRAIREAFSSSAGPQLGEGLGRDVMRLAHAVQTANDQILDAAKRERLEGMGTTVCAARFSPNKRRLYIGHVGDSRCYRLRAATLKQITADHTMRDLGVTGPEASNLSRAVGVWPSVPIDVVKVAPRPGDVYLLCSDGLTKMVRDAEIAEVLRSETDPQAAVERLIDLANANGGKDNITVIVVRVVPPVAATLREGPAVAAPATVV